VYFATIASLTITCPYTANITPIAASTANQFEAKIATARHAICNAASGTKISRRCRRSSQCPIRSWASVPKR
jgi:hypothetical protein